MQWVRDNVRHPNFAGVDLPPDRAMTEEQLIDSGVGWCNEQCRVFIALCGVMEIPARLCFLFHANGKTAHTATEVELGGTMGHARCDVRHLDRLCPTMSPWPRDAISAASISRSRPSNTTRIPLTEYYRGRPTPIDLARGGDLFAEIGICNYLIDGVEAVRD